MKIIPFTTRRTLPGIPASPRVKALDEINSILTRRKAADSGSEIEDASTIHHPPSTIVERQKHFLAMEDGYQPGAIIYSCWGWEQTNIDFYRIEKRTGDFITLAPLESELITHDSHQMSGNRVPADTPKNYQSGSDVAWGNKDLQNPKPTFRRKLKRGTNGKISGLSISSGWARIWNGKPMGCSWYA